MVSPYILVYILFLSTTKCWGSQQITGMQDEQRRLLDTLLQSYDIRLRPAGPNSTDEPVEVKVNMLLRDVTSISDYDMDYGVQILLRQEWLDERLKFYPDSKYVENIKYLIVTDNSKIWTPDIFIQNEKDSELHKLMNPNTFIRIYPDGRVLYSARLSLQLWCHMNMERFPFDTQICSLKMASYGLTTDFQRLSWKEGQALQISIHANIMGFTIGNGATSTCSSITNTGVYSCLKVDFPFKRDTKYYIYHTFLPSMVLVLVSWASFWLDRRAVVARILIVLSTLFAMSSLAADIEASVPHVPYVKAMDLWIAVCFLFLLAALVEFALVNSNILPEEMSQEGTINVDLKPLVRQSTESSLAQDKASAKVSQLPMYRDLLARLPKDPRRLDSVARRLFPAFYFAFIFVYFFVYLVFDGPSHH